MSPALFKQADVIYVWKGGVFALFDEVDNCGGAIRTFSHLVFTVIPLVPAIMTAVAISRNKP